MIRFLKDVGCSIRVLRVGFQAAAGEKIFLLDRSKIPNEIKTKLKDDFWLFDDSAVMLQIYDEKGTLQQSQLSTDRSIVANYQQIRDWALGLAQPQPGVKAGTPRTSA